MMGLSANTNERKIELILDVVIPLLIDKII